ncbi:hypothetical protein VB005_11782 [Metarhizium brunneum]
MSTGFYFQFTTMHYAPEEKSQFPNRHSIIEAWRVPKISTALVVSKPAASYNGSQPASQPDSSLSPAPWPAVRANSVAFTQCLSSVAEDQHRESQGPRRSRSAGNATGGARREPIPNMLAAAFATRIVFHDPAKLHQRSIYSPNCRFWTWRFLGFVALRCGDKSHRVSDDSSTRRVVNSNHGD